MSRPCFTLNNNKYISAGLIIYGKRRDTTYVLLQYSRHKDQQWWWWSDLGGKSEPGDTSLIDVATREATEELNGHLFTRKELQESLCRDYLVDGKYASFLCHVDLDKLNDFQEGEVYECDTVEKHTGIERRLYWFPLNTLLGYLLSLTNGFRLHPRIKRYDLIAVLQQLHKNDQTCSQPSQDSTQQEEDESGFRTPIPTPRSTPEPTHGHMSSYDISGFITPNTSPTPAMTTPTLANTTPTLANTTMTSPTLANTTMTSPTLANTTMTSPTLANTTMTSPTLANTTMTYESSPGPSWTPEYYQSPPPAPKQRNRHSRRAVHRHVLEVPDFSDLESLQAPPGLTQLKDSPKDSPEAKRSHHIFRPPIKRLSFT